MHVVVVAWFFHALRSGALVLSRLDYSNGVLAGLLPASQLNHGPPDTRSREPWLNQLRHIYGARRRDHVTQLLQRLAYTGWLFLSAWSSNCVFWHFAVSAVLVRTTCPLTSQAYPTCVHDKDYACSIHLKTGQLITTSVLAVLSLKNWFLLLVQHVPHQFNCHPSAWTLKEWSAYEYWASSLAIVLR